MKLVIWKNYLGVKFCTEVWTLLKNGVIVISIGNQPPNRIGILNMCGDMEGQTPPGNLLKQIQKLFQEIMETLSSEGLQYSLLSFYCRFFKMYKYIYVNKCYDYMTQTPPQKYSWSQFFDVVKTVLKIANFTIFLGNNFF